jgi:hypothetical protein
MECFTLFILLILLLVILALKGRAKTPEQHLATVMYQREMVAQQEHHFAIAQMQAGIPDEMGGQFVLGYCVEMQQPSLQLPPSDKLRRIVLAALPYRYR